MSDRCSSPARARVCARPWAERLTGAGSWSLVTATSRHGRDPVPVLWVNDRRGVDRKLPQHHTGRTRASSLGVWGHRFHGCTPTPGRPPNPGPAPQLAGARSAPLPKAVRSHGGRPGAERARGRSREWPSSWPAALWPSCPVPDVWVPVGRDPRERAASVVAPSGTEALRERGVVEVRGLRFCESSPGSLAKPPSYPALAGLIVEDL